MRILALTRYGMLAASTRQRFQLYEHALAEAGIAVDYAPLFSNDHVHRLVIGGRASLIATAVAYAGRVAALLKARRYDALWVHYELFPYLPGSFERLASLTGIPVVFDYDDAVFHYYDASSSPLVRRLLGRKLEPILKTAAACLCGNPYLRDYAARFCDRSIVLPTVVDTSIYRPSPRAADERTVIGWIGSPTTWRNVRPLLPLLREMARNGQIRIRAVGAGAKAKADAFDGLEFVEWSEASEVAQVQGMDIGIMPLLDRPFERGKSGYKLIQYMACGLPVVASPVGVNRDIVRIGENGFLASDPEQWSTSLQALIEDPGLRSRLGQAGRARVETDYSLASQAPRLVEVFREVIRR